MAGQTVAFLLGLASVLAGGALHHRGHRLPEPVDLRARAGPFHAGEAAGHAGRGFLDRLWPAADQADARRHGLSDRRLSAGRLRQIGRGDPRERRSDHQSQARRVHGQALVAPGFGGGGRARDQPALPCPGPLPGLRQHRPQLSLGPAPGGSRGQPQRRRGRRDAAGGPDHPGQRPAGDQHPPFGQHGGQAQPPDAWTSPCTSACCAQASRWN